MLCSQSYCCQTEVSGDKVGACAAHAQYCGAGVGVFLRVRECQILLMASRSKGSFYNAPYLDTYGETDQGLRYVVKGVARAGPGMGQPFKRKFLLCTICCKGYGQRWGRRGQPFKSNKK